MWLIKRRRGVPDGRPRHAGQTLVEFAMVFPIFLLLLFAIIEFAFVFSGMLGISYATRDAALVAAEAGWGLAGSDHAADCVIIKAVDQAVSPPADDNRITSITIFKADRNGDEVSGASNTWTRGSSTSCPDGTTIPYTRQTNGYPEGVDASNVPYRCNWLGGCGGGRPLDTIGVRVEYQHRWVTPLGGLGGNGFSGQGGPGFTLTQSNSMRMEPIL
jgi:Flp pilus assembly protein TadG